MSREKQIDEIAKDVWKASCAGQGIECTKCENANNSTDEYSCVDFVISQNLYNAGYRKQSEGEWIEKYKGQFANPIYVCSICGKGTLLKPHINELGNMEMVQALSPFCPNCGAKMKGGE